MQTIHSPQCMPCITSHVHLTCIHKNYALFDIIGVTSEGLSDVICTASRYLSYIASCAHAQCTRALKVVGVDRTSEASASGGCGRLGSHTF